MSQASGRRLRARRALVRRTVLQIQPIWSQLDLDNVAGSWAVLSPRVVELVTEAQRQAASGADEYVAQAAAELGVASRPAGPINPTRLAGVASDGRPLDTLMLASPLRTLRALSVTGNGDEARAAGLTKLVQLTATQLYDSGRGADSVAITTNQAVAGWRRKLRAPSCDRCIVLADRFYPWSSGFRRHPMCDCVHEPALRGDQPGEDLSPQRTFDRMPKAEQDRVFGEAPAQAIRDGADLRQVVNARRGMKTVTAYGRKVSATTEGTTTTGFAGRRLAAAGEELQRQRSLTFTTLRGARRTRERVRIPRLMPEQIYADAVDREDAIRLLRRFGYI